MANQGTLADWLLSRHDSIDFHLTSYSWVDDYAPGNSDWGISLGNKLTGRATDKDSNLALTKAIAEMIERATCDHNTLSSSTGVAAHIDFPNACLNAKHELIERVSFDLHWSKQMPFKKVMPVLPASKRLALRFAGEGIEFSLYELISPPGIHVLCAVATGAKCSVEFGGIIGLGCSGDRQRAEESALFEAIRNVVFFISSEIVESHTLAKFREIEGPLSFDRFRLGLNVDYWKEISFLFSGTGEQNREFPNITYNFRELTKPALFSSAPVVVVQAHCDYEFGKNETLPSVLG